LSEQDREKDPGTPPEPPDWQTVLRLSTEILADKSKDMWVAAWMIEALARRHQFAGLRDGFRLVRELGERYWDHLHPQPDVEEGEDISETLSQMSSLNGLLPAAIEQIPITPETASYPELTSADYKDASHSAADGSITLGMFDSAVREANPQFFRNLSEDIDQARAEFDLLDRLWDEKCGQDEERMSLAPATSNIKNTLAECSDRIRSLAKHILVPDPQEESAQPASSKSDTAPAPRTGPAAARGSIGEAAVQNREDAFRALVKVADFFKRTEPHSPLAYKLEEAVRWGRLTLPELMDELMRDLISDDTTRQEMFRRAGIPQARPKDAE
jgi:type VI secretion system protein ImpA